MRKNKTIAYALAATLLVGGTFVGTKALFTDTTDVAGELKISTGDLDIEVVDAGTWELERNGSEHKDGTTISDEEGTGTGRLDEERTDIKNEDVPDGAFANNLKPGDILTKTVTIENKGTLVATNIELNATGSETLNNGLLKLTTNDLDKKQLNPGEKAEFNLELLVEDVGGEHNKEGFNSDTQENNVINLDELKDKWTLTAQQQNTDFGKDTITQP